jgi:hypothetical protein
LETQDAEAMADALVIHREDGLWELLDNLLSPQFPASIPLELIQLSWSPELLYFPEESVGHVITPVLARAVTGFHSSLSRGYAALTR